MIPPKENSLIGSYRVVRKLGDDLCFAEFIAEHLFLVREFRIVVLVHDDVYQAPALEALKADLGEFSRLCHPALPQIYDAQQVNSYFFFTSSVVNGEILRKRMTRSKIRSVEEFTALFRRLGDIVLYLQSNNISSQNLTFADIVERDGELYISRVNLLASPARVVNTEDEQLKQHMLKASGPFFQKGSFDTRGNIRRIGELMYEAVAWGSLDEALEIRRKEEEEISKKRKSPAQVRLVSDIAPEIEDVIVRTRQELDAGGYRTLKDLFDEVESLGQRAEGVGAETAPAAASGAVAPDRETAWDYTPQIEVPEPQVEHRARRVFRWKRYVGLLGIACAGAAIIMAFLFYAPPLWTQRNNPPVARAIASPRMTFAGGQVDLDGSASFDPDHDVLIYHWEVVEPPDARVDLSTNASRQARQIKATFHQKGKYRIVLRVHDGTAFSQPAYVTVIVY
jgi:hypothetical protein